jgi:hypothetical protein
MVRAEWRVEPAGSSSNGDGGDGNDMDESVVEEQAESLLVEDLTVECVSWMMGYMLEVGGEVGSREMRH